MSLQLRTTVLACMLLALMPTSASASDVAVEPAKDCKTRLHNEVTCFIAQAQYARLICSTKWQLAILKGIADDAIACVAEVSPGLEEHFKAARGKLAKNKSATDALKDAYSYLLVTLRGLAPDGGETQMEYRRRQSAREHGLEDRLAKLQLEQ